MKVNNPRNILRYQSRGIIGLSGKQAVFLAIGIVLFLGIGVVLIVAMPLPMPIPFLISLVIAAPFLASAFLKVSGIYFNEVLVRLLQDIFLGRSYRPYKTGEKRK